MTHRIYRLSAALLATGLVGVGITAARAQDPATPPPTEFTLAYKYQTGNIQKFRLETKSDLTLTPEGGGGIAASLGPLPIASKMTTAYTEKVAGTRQGTGTLTIKVDSLLIDTNVMGRASVIKVQNGKTTATVDGQPAPEGALGGAANSLSTKPVTVKRDPRGLVTSESGGMPAGGAGASIAQLPDHPVKVGDSWEVVQQVAANLPGPGGGIAPPLDVRFTHTLKEVVTKNGKQFALIESMGSGSTPADAAGPSLNQSITGTTRFDIARGAVASGQYNMDISMKLGTAALPGGGAAGAGGPSSVKIDGLIAMTLIETPATPAAPAKKPAAKKAKKRK